MGGDALLDEIMEHDKVKIDDNEIMDDTMEDSDPVLTQVDADGQ